MTDAFQMLSPTGMMLWRLDIADREVGCGGSCATWRNTSLLGCRQSQWRCRLYRLHRSPCPPRARFILPNDLLLLSPSLPANYECSIAIHLGQTKAIKEDFGLDLRIGLEDHKGGRGQPFLDEAFELTSRGDTLN